MDRAPASSTVVAASTSSLSPDVALAVHFWQIDDLHGGRARGSETIAIESGRIRPGFQMRGKTDALGELDDLTLHDGELGEQLFWKHANYLARRSESRLLWKGRSLT